MAVTDGAVDLDKAHTGAPSTVDVGTQPTTAAIAAAQAAAVPTTVPEVPPLVAPLADASQAPRAGSKAALELELAEMRERLAALEATAPVVTATDGLPHAEYCIPRPGNTRPRVEHLRVEKVHPRTGHVTGTVNVTRCLECGAQREKPIAEE